MVLHFEWAYGCFFVPSDGNLYDTWFDGSGSTNAPRATILNVMYPIEKGCAGDAFLLHNIHIYRYGWRWLARSF